MRLHDQIAAELEHIPPGDALQTLFRSTYRNLRAYDLSEAPPRPRSETMRDTLVLFHKQYPDRVPEFDHESFGIPAAEPTEGREA